MSVKERKSVTAGGGLCGQGLTGEECGAGGTQYCAMLYPSYTPSYALLLGRQNRQEDEHFTLANARTQVLKACSQIITNAKKGS